MYRIMVVFVFLAIGILVFVNLKQTPLETDNQTKNSDSKLAANDTGQQPVEIRHGRLTPSEATESSPPVERPDTPFFIYSRLAKGQRAQNMQGAGATHKVGVESHVATMIGNGIGLLEKLLESNADRDQCLIDGGYTPKLPMRFRYWHVNVTEARPGAEGGTVLSIWASAGAKWAGPCTDGLLQEEWLLKDNQLLLQSRTTHGQGAFFGRSYLTDPQGFPPPTEIEQ